MQVGGAGSQGATDARPGAMHMLTPATRAGLRAALDRSAAKGTKPSVLERIIASLGTMAGLAGLAAVGWYLSIQVIQYQTYVIEKDVRAERAARRSGGTPAREGVPGRDSPARVPPVARARTALVAAVPS